MKTEIRMNMFHTSTQQLFKEVLEDKRKEEGHIYRASKVKLNGMINFFGLFFAQVYQDDKGNYITSPFDLNLVFDYALKIRKWADTKSQKKLGRILFSNKEYNRIQNLQKKTKQEIVTRVIL